MILAVWKLRFIVVGLNKLLVHEGLVFVNFSVTDLCIAIIGCAVFFSFCITTNIVPVLKRKTGAVRICVDYRNLNEASPKDEYPMPMADMLMDGAAHNQMLSFMDGSAWSVHKESLVQDNKEGKEQAIYYLSRTLTEVERKYSAIERLCLALYFTAVKLKHYMLPFTIYIIAKTDLIQYMLMRPMLRGRIGKWTLALTEFAFRYIPQKAVKGQAVADFLVDHPGEEIEKWTLWT
ncbi:hypothetical protein L3X38_045441 [Prunus dulcis]|uniref:Reverse transcriptase RNase H-like domain-containing protein n=1 Tax=Prunus dulcis TaxID=3755 RepID=A0AAD4V0J0_PRUDU|nr:hypothetical protein L3X38_045441 [Prunus dulcis]